MRLSASREQSPQQSLELMPNLDLASLSEREREIVDHAIEGLTDQQIGNQLRITSSTVNSYWVRIRGKIGHLSRTEMVSKIVQQIALQKEERLNERIRGLEAQLRGADFEKNPGFYIAAIENSPGAIVLFDESGQVLLSNGRFADLFDVSCQQTVGLTFF